MNAQQVERILPGWDVPGIEDFLWLSTLDGMVPGPASSPTERKALFLDAQEQPAGISEALLAVKEEERPLLISFLRQLWSDLRESGDPGVFSALVMLGDEMLAALDSITAPEQEEARAGQVQASAAPLSAAVT